MKRETLEAIDNSQFKETYFLLMDIEHNGNTYLKALETVSFINETLLTTRKEEGELIDLATVNEIFSDVVQEIKEITQKINTDDENQIVVLSGKVARILLKKGYRIIDIKANKYNKQKTVFIFKKESGIEEDISLLTANSGSPEHGFRYKLNTDSASN